MNLTLNRHVIMKKVKVNIEITETTRYASVIEISEEEYKQLESDLEAGGYRNRQATIKVGGYIDARNDWVDATTESVEEFSLVKEGEGK